jgi:heat shock protein HslJ
MRTKLSLAFLIFGAFALILAGCAPAGSQPPSTGDSLEGTSWQLESISPTGAENPVIGETPLTLEFQADGQAGGEGGCNSFGATYQVEDGKLTFGEITQTERACVDTRLMEQEQQYFEALRTADSYVLAGDRLTILFDGGQGSLEFTKASSE